MNFSKPLKIYPTAMHACSYLPGQVARNAVVDPDLAMTMLVYDYLIKSGFRRSGNQVYRPYCESCNGCITTRIAVNEFKPDRSQRRNAKQNQDLQVIVNANGFKPAYAGMYARYVQSRHKDTEVDGVEDFLTAHWCDTLFVEFHDAEELIAVATIDKLASGLSAVYTFFDPEKGSKRGLGVFALLWQIDYAKQLGLDYVYPGYWIKDCRKMNYKTRYQPLEGLVHGVWQPLEKQ
ncbi:MAG: arginyltransferase [Proteobacteria bacterium]|nr:MAG: arginyltransferase [Pseudomonadota bacterium]